MKPNSPNSRIISEMQETMAGLIKAGVANLNQELSLGNRFNERDLFQQATEPTPHPK